MKKIGLLLPKSTYYSTIGFDIFEGLKSNLKNIGIDQLKIITENIGFGADKQQCYRAAEKLILDEDVELVIAYIGHRAAELLRPLFLATNKILIVLDAGANMPQEWSVCPNIIYHSLHNSLGAYLSSQLAIKKGYKTGGMVTGYYDGGYLQTYSISKSFEDAGGKICFNHATGYKDDDFTMEPLIEHIKSHPDSALLSLFSGDYVQWYFEKTKNLFGETNLPIFLTPFGLEETMLKNAVCPSTNIHGIAAWSKEIKNTENNSFIEHIESVGKKPNLFSLLGWESAVIIQKVLTLLEINNNNITKVISDLDSFEFKSPRGLITFHSKYNHTIAPLYEALVVPDESGNSTLKINAIIENTANYFDDLYNQELNEATSAWYNSYACI
ncbi:ABC transporter substrate-binding protein [Flavobacterium sp. H122]|uniref:ABC transporter substrate-binding protein n=1 Tax=Flavobacterium sp. H122 TaxID=2529860 RepID=UPI0010AAB2BD|nr:ABC transporter substrate-binding protein [Flavobacterium sp. H122]